MCRSCPADRIRCLQPRSGGRTQPRDGDQQDRLAARTAGIAALCRQPPFGWPTFALGCVRRLAATLSPLRFAQNSRMFMETQSGWAATKWGATAPGKQVAPVGRSNSWRDNKIVGLSSAERQGRRERRLARESHFNENSRFAAPSEIDREQKLAFADYCGCHCVYGRRRGTCG